MLASLIFLLCGSSCSINSYLSMCFVLLPHVLKLDESMSAHCLFIGQFASRQPWITHVKSFLSLSLHVILRGVQIGLFSSSTCIFEYRVSHECSRVKGKQIYRSRRPKSGLYMCQYTLMCTMWYMDKNGLVKSKCNNSPKED